jgi:hypothetical protein
MKKNIFKIAVGILAVVLAGCLDDKDYALDPSGAKSVIEFYDNSVPTNPSGAVYPVWTNVTPLVTDTTFNQTVSYSGINGNDKDIELTLAIDQAALDEYNAQRVDEDGNANNTYSLMPASYYEFDDYTVTIPKGQTKVDIQLKVFPNNFDLSKNFALPIRIVSASHGLISAHFSVAMMAVVVKNDYDGIYEIKGGTITRNSGAGPDLTLGGTYVSGLKMPFATINGTSNSFAPLWKDGSGVGGVAGTRVSLNPAGVTTDADGYTVIPVSVTSTGNATLKNTVGQINFYYPVQGSPGAGKPAITKAKFILNFDWGAAPSTRIVSGLVAEYSAVR